MRRFLICLVIASVLAAGGGCSQPVDTGSPVPAQEQPLVALLALAGLAIGVVAFIHHEHAKASPGPSPSPGITGPKLFVQLSARGTDMNIADITSAVIVGVLQSGSPATYQQATIPSGGSPQMASCVLPPAYAPTALAIDATGAIWFDDDTGHVKRFAPISTTGGACPSPSSLTDGLTPSGTRSMDADATNVYIAVDDGTGKVSFVEISTTTLTGPGNSTGAASAVLDPKDGITSTTFLNAGIPTFTGFRTDGSSFVVQNNTATANSFDLSPLPNGNPTVSMDASNNEVFFGLIGSSSSGLYQIAKYNSGGSQMSAISIASGGVTADSRFAVPLSSLRADHNRNTYALDANGNLVEFAGF